MRLNRLSWLFAFGTFVAEGGAVAQSQSGPPVPAPRAAPSTPPPTQAPAPAQPSPFTGVAPSAPAAPAPAAPAASTAPAAPAPAAPAEAAPPAAPAAPAAPGAPGAPGASPPAVPPPPVATPPSAALIEPLPPVPAPDPTVHRHDGFYLRLGLGGGFMASRLEPSGGTLNASGGGVALEIALGGTVADGLVIGGGLYGSGTGEVKWKGDSLGSGSVKGGQGSLGLLGLMADYYPDPKEGFHVQGALGFGTLSFDADKHSGIPPQKWAGAGGGAMLGVGYEFWVGSQWSIGGVARLLLVSGTLKIEDSSDDFSGKGYAPSILFTATNH